MTRPSFDLLIVDDDPSQLHLFENLVIELGLPHRCHYAPNGSRALDFLRKKPPYNDAPTPHLILLDLHMPGISGCEVLRVIKSDVQLRRIPVIMLTTSQATQDVKDCYTEHANAYFSKRPDLQSNLRLLQGIDQFWAEAEMPPA